MAHGSPSCAERRDEAVKIVRGWDDPTALDRAYDYAAKVTGLSRQQVNQACAAANAERRRYACQQRTGRDTV